MPKDKTEEIQDVIRDYYYALDCRKHGGVAQNNAFNRIENILGMHWQQGQETKRRETQEILQHWVPCL